MSNSSKGISSSRIDYTLDMPDAMYTQILRENRMNKIATRSQYTHLHSQHDYAIKRHFEHITIKALLTEALDKNDDDGDARETTRKRGQLTLKAAYVTKPHGRQWSSSICSEGGVGYNGARNTSCPLQWPA